MNPAWPPSVLRVAALALAAASLCGCLAARIARRSEPPPVAVAPNDPSVRTWSDVWHDARRQRAVPVKIYYPAGGATAPWPVVLFSHGLGGSREGYAYLGQAWAAHGFVSVHVQHEGSDEAVWRDSARPLKAIRESVMDPSTAVNRPLDLSFALDRLEQLAKDPAFPLHGRLDFSRVGAAGHSFGAFTVMALAGWAPADAELRSPEVADPRIKAAIAMSTPLARRDREGPASGYTRVKIPVLHLTGTLDTDRAGGASDPAFRRIPYDRTAHAPA